MDHVIADLNDLCSRDIYLRYADNHIRLSRLFITSLYWTGWRWQPRLCAILVCKCPHNDLDRTDVLYPYRNKDEVQAAVEAARNENLDT